MPVKGVSRVKANFRKLAKEISEDRSERAVYQILSQGGSLAAVKTPVDTGALINSHFVYIMPEPGRVVGRTGYTAAYAEFVHEAPGTLKGQARPGNRGDYWDPNAEPHFLAAGFDELEPKIPGILRRNYKV